jgi:transcriptional regulator with XRE-family HTH domain
MAERKKTKLGITFGRVLQEARTTRGITQEQLAALIDYSRVQIGYLETGVREPSLEALLRLEPALGLPPGELVRRTAKAVEDGTKSRTRQP